MIEATHARIRHGFRPDEEPFWEFYEERWADSDARDGRPFIVISTHTDTRYESDEPWW